MPKINFKETQALEELANEMLVEKGLLEQDRAQHGKLRHELVQQLNETIERAVIGALSDVQLVEFDRMLDADVDDQEIEDFFDRSGVDFEKAANEALMKYRAEYLGVEAENREGKTENDA